ncbi:cytochrome c biogenesis heme-transporting ATPase CcmA [Niveibacterium sp. SC-1]|uniref:cytochrome c biogenesis heme-transporting ATPase CcmA n=1 Tax=Niveibacterium sp. SC-1 TaxID=3135646 RepID=UPI00311F4EB2
MTEGARGHLRGEGLACVRGDRELFASLDFELHAGECLHVRGANGAGKTSLLRQLAGLSRPASGKVLWNGTDIARDSDDYRAALLYLGHPSGVKDDLTVIENLRIAAAIDGGALDEGDALSALGRIGLNGRADLPVRVLSQGQRRRALLARLIVRPARIWILDEPFTALDVRAVGLVGELLSEHLAQGGMAVLTSHQAVPLAGARELEL